jgi:hypothetical protein
MKKTTLTRSSFLQHLAEAILRGEFEGACNNLDRQLGKLHLGIEEAEWILDAMSSWPEIHWDVRNPLYLSCTGWDRFGLRPLLKERILTKPTPALIQMYASLATSDLDFMDSIRLIGTPTSEDRLDILAVLRRLSESEFDQSIKHYAHEFADYVQNVLDFHERCATNKESGPIAPHLPEIQNNSLSASITELKSAPPKQVEELTKIEVFELLSEAIERDENLINVGYEIVERLNQTDNGIVAVEWILDAMSEWPDADWGGPGPLFDYCLEWFRRGLEPMLLRRVIEKPGLVLLDLFACLADYCMLVPDSEIQFQKTTHSERQNILRILEEVAVKAESQDVRDHAKYLANGVMESIQEYDIRSS